MLKSVLSPWLARTVGQFPISVYQAPRKTGGY